MGNPGEKQVFNNGPSRQIYDLRVPVPVPLCRKFANPGPGKNLTLVNGGKIPRGTISRVAPRIEMVCGQIMVAMSSVPQFRVGPFFRAG